MVTTTLRNETHGIETSFSSTTDRDQAPVAIPSYDGLQKGDEMEVLKVSARSRSTAVAGAIAGVMRDQNTAEVQAIGASAVNQAIKAVAIARGYLAAEGIEIVCVPSFTEVEIDGQERTAVKLSIMHR